MSLLSYKPVYRPKIELKSKECIDAILQPLKDHVTIKINGSLTSEDVFRNVLSMAVNRNSVHSITTQYQDVACETSLLYRIKKLNMEERIKSNEKILLQEVIKTLKQVRAMNSPPIIPTILIMEKKINQMRNM